ncbi:FG-GAP-like repeat-containing protein [Flavobacterium sp.]|uniref:FG-GAP-like repeat-containing protein n=1 Tax=Flavobacterium sp. TaxID=239 RepID=UPI002633FEB1|nr:FG-GAP-like repeat-containing protein [Flavobacterium sp.]
MNLKNYAKSKLSFVGNFGLLLLLMACFGFHCSYGQNSCAAPQTVTAGTYTVAQIDGTNISTTCSTASFAEWFAYTPTANYSVTVTSDLIQNICGDTNFTVYTGSCGALSCYAKDDDSGTIACNVAPNTNQTYLSKKTFDALAGVTYYIAWDSKWNTNGFDFQIIEAPFVPSPCYNATSISAGTVTINAIDGTNVNTTCSTAPLAKWYAYTPTQDYFVTITSDLPQNICKNTFFSVYTGSCSGGLTCVTSDDNSGVIACDSGNTFSYLSQKSFNVVGGTTYYIAWDSRGGTDGFDFQLSEAPTPCASAISITAGTITVDAVNGTNASTTCSTATQGKWYVYTPSQDYHVTITSDLPQNICKDTNFNVYTGSCTGTLTCFASDDNSGNIACDSGNSFSNLSKKTFDVVGGTTYYIAWDNKWSSDGFDFELTENQIIVPVNYTSQTIATIPNTGYNICVADMNGDLLDDIVSVNTNALKIHYQNTNGIFTVGSFTVPGNSNMPGWSMAAGDLNKDGYNDLLLGSSNGLTFWKSNETGTAYTSETPGEYIFCQRTNFVDINNDGNLDAFSCHDIDPNVYYLNNGDGTMTYYQSGTTPGAYSLGVTPSGGNYASLWTDYDNDGDVDMFISKCSGPPCELHRNDGNGVFTDISALAGINVTPITTWSSAIADFDNDGDMDIMIGKNGSVGGKFFRNDLDTSNNVEEPFVNVTAGSGWESDTSNNQDYVAYDFDNDGWVDIFGAGGKIMFNQGDMTFLPTVYTNLNPGPIGDLNNDGFLDFQSGATIRYAVPNGNHWLKVGLKGTTSNKNGIAARVEIYGAWGKQIRDIRSGDGFRYMNSINAHFGIGSATTIDKIVINWPSGTIDVINNPSIDSMVTVNEGAFPLTITEAENDAFVIFPNPVSDILNIKSKSNAAIIKAEIFDMSGKMILKKESVNSTIPVNTLSNGTYIIKILDVNGRQYTQKFVKS